MGRRERILGGAAVLGGLAAAGGVVEHKTGQVREQADEARAELRDSTVHLQHMREAAEELGFNPYDYEGDLSNRSENDQNMIRAVLETYNRRVRTLDYNTPLEDDRGENAGKLWRKWHEVSSACKYSAADKQECSQLLNREIPAMYQDYKARKPEVDINPMSVSLDDGRKIVNIGQEMLEVESFVGGLPDLQEQYSFILEAQASNLKTLLFNVGFDYNERYDQESTESLLGQQQELNWYVQTTLKELAEIDQVLYQHGYQGGMTDGNYRYESESKSVYTTLGDVQALAAESGYGMYSLERARESYQKAGAQEEVNKLDRQSLEQDLSSLEKGSDFANFYNFSKVYKAAQPEVQAEFNDRLEAVAKRIEDTDPGTLLTAFSIYELLGRSAEASRIAQKIDAQEKETE